MNARSGGRYRQFHQIGAEALGFPGAELDAELIFACQCVVERAWPAKRAP